MQWLANVCVRRPVLATVIILSLVVVGIFSYFRLGVDRFPKVDFPIVTITLREDGASPEEMETDVVDKVEEACNTISGIDQVTSTSYDGVGVVAITFVLEKDINVAAQEVRDKVSTALPDLPLDLKPPVVDKVDPDSSAILYVTLSTTGNVRQATEYADKVLRRQIENINGVGQVRLIGGRKRQVNIQLDPSKLRAFGLTAVDVQRALQTQNIQVPGGDVDQDTRKLTLRTHGRVQTTEEFDSIVITKRGPNPVRISDVGFVEDSTEDLNTTADLNGTPTILLAIRKQSGTNTVATVDAVREKLAQINKTLPGGYRLRVVRDQSDYIRASTDAVKNHLMLGSLLAAIVVLLFLWNFRTTIISALAIPASIISTFTLMYVMGFSVNSLTLLALTLSVGIVIDDAIVVLENIYRFIEEKRLNPIRAAIEATREIGPAVMATTLSLIAVFLPVGFMSGIVGRFMGSFGLTMAFAIFVSLIVSFTLTPMLSSRWIKSKTTEPDPHEGSEGMPVSVTEAVSEEEEAAEPTPTGERISDADHHGARSKETGFFRVIDAVYTVMLKWSMRHRWVIVLLCLLSLASMKWIIGPLPKNFLPEDDESQFSISVRTPEGASLPATQKLADRIATATRRLPGVDYTILTIGDNNQQTPNLASVFVKLKDVDSRPGLSQQDIMQRARKEILPQFGRLRASVGPVPAFSTGAPAASITFVISGPNLDTLTDYSQRTLSEIKKMPGVVDADTSLVLGKPELGVFIDRDRAADLGVSVADISNALRILVGGLKVSDYYENGEQYEVHLRAELPFRNDPTIIKNMTVPSSVAPAGWVPLDQVVHFKAGSGPAQVNRLNRRRDVLITCNVLPGYSQQAVTTRLQQITKDMHIGPGYSAEPSGTSRELAKAGIAFGQAFLLALIFMYLILAAQFESWVHPVTILLALPLTVPFALFSLLIFHQSLNIYTALGLLVLFGVVKKNGILQVDHTNQLRARGMNRYDAIITANRDRLRPILMTTIAFVAGMIPLVVARGTGAATNQGIGYAVIGGQTLSLGLTLLATPVFYSIFDDMSALHIGERLRRLFRRR